MFALEIRFLTGRYAAGRYDEPGRAEWPPHPARIFSALTAAMYEQPDPPANERAALEWLAEAGAPHILGSDAAFRHLGQVYVPVNDVKALRDIDRYLDQLADAEQAAAAAEGKQLTKAERRLEKARDKLRDRSAATAAADGKGTPDSAIEVLERRPRHPRRFPVAIPVVDEVSLVWPDQEPSPDVRDSLDRLCARVARVGHSSSLASLRVLNADEVEEKPEGPTRWIPDPSGHHFIRVPLPDQLRLLDEAHEQHGQTEPRVLPADPVPYRVAIRDGEAVQAVHSLFSDRAGQWITYEVVEPPEGGRRTLLDLSLGQQVARALRGTLLTSLESEAPETLTGHDSEGRPSSRPHLAFVPLADVGHPHASGAILGIAMVPPRDLSVEHRDVLLEAIFRAELSTSRDAKSRDGSGTVTERRLRLTMGRHGVVHLRRLVGPSDRSTLTSQRWCRTARRWVSATAVALGRNPGNLRSRDPDVLARATEAAEGTVAEACEFVGLPTPQAVWIHRRSLVTGAPSARRFMPFPDQGGGPRRVCVHTEIVFEQPVTGPVLLGAGRFFGLGLHVPADSPPAWRDR